LEAVGLNAITSLRWTVDGESSARSETALNRNGSGLRSLVEACRH